MQATISAFRFECQTANSIPFDGLNPACDGVKKQSLACRWSRFLVGAETLSSMTPRGSSLVLKAMDEQSVFLKVECVNHDGGLALDQIINVVRQKQADSGCPQVAPSIVNRPVMSKLTSTRRSLNVIVDFGLVQHWQKTWFSVGDRFAIALT